VRKTYQRAATSLRIVFALTVLLLMAMPFTAVGQDALDDSVFISIRHYDGVDPADLAELERITVEGFVPIISGSEGFIAYYVVHPVDGTLTAINVFETREQALASNELAGDFVVEKLAPLLPNAPLIVEGSVDIGFVEMLDGMADGDVSSLHASLRIYDGFEADDLNEFVAIVEDGFLPIMRETDGFFGYYLMHDSADQLAALSIFDSEASAIASNKSATDFVAENLTQYLPNDPSITAGRVAIAVLAGVNDGENIIDEDIFASIRVYDDLDPKGLEGLYLRNAEEFLDIIRDDDGFISYYWLDSGEQVVTISLYDTKEQATASNAAASQHIADSLVDVKPGPPRIVEGLVDIGFIEMLDGMADGVAGSLYASARLYDGFEADDLDEFVAIVEDGFLPIMRESDGFFGYYLMHDVAGTLVAISIFDSEESALASNAKAADFVAENLTAYLPNNPAIASGQVGIAALAAVDEGANLIEDMMDDNVFASIRVYDGVDPQDMETIIQLTAEGFLPIMRGSDGFVAYFLLPEGDNLAAISAFETAEQATASNEQAREFVVENLAPLLPNAPMVVQGPMDTRNFARLDDMTMVDEVTSLYASLRVYVEVDLTQRAETTALVNSIFLPSQQETEGFWGYVRMHDGESRSAALSIYDSEENALAANELAAAFVAEYLTDRPDQVPLRVSGRLGIAALADLNEGANLIEDMMHDSVFASIRVYDGVDPGDQAEIARQISERLAVIRGRDGFAGYYLLPAGDMLAVISLFQTAEQASTSSEAAREFVAENLAPLLPNPPLVVEGTVEVSTQLMFNVVDPGDLSMPLYAALVSYDGFDMARLDEAAALVDSHLVPALIDQAGLFSYHAGADGVDRTFALRVFGSEAQLQRSNEIAAEFVAKHMADWLPEDPLVVEGRLGVASIQAILEGVNLAQYGADEARVFASVRLYDGIDPMDMDTIVQLTAEGFLPIIRESDGFVGYYFLPAGDMLATVSLFDSAEQAAASNDAARAFIVENLAPLLPNAPQIFEGPLSVNHVAALSDGDEYAEVDELHASIRFYEGFDLRHFDEANDLAIAHLLPALEELGGLFAQFAFNDGEDTVVGISIFESEEAALAANDAGKAFTIEYLADWAPNPPTGVAGRLAIATQAEINMGENLVG